MPNYTILGVTFFIPDLNDAQNFIVAPIEDFVTQALSGISGAVNVVISPIEVFVQDALNLAVNDIKSAFQFLYNLGQDVSNSVVAALSSLVNEVVADVRSGFAAASNALTSLRSLLLDDLRSALDVATNDIRSTFQGIVGTILTNLQDLGHTEVNLWNTVRADSAQAYNAIHMVINSGLTTLQNNLNTYVLQPVNSLGQNFANEFVKVEQALNNVAVYTSSAFNQLSTDIGSSFNALGNGISFIGHDIFSALMNDIVIPAEKGISAGVQDVVSFAKNLNRSIGNALLQLLPKTPDEAFNAALSVAEFGVLTLAVGETAALIAEAVYPTKHLGITEALHKAMDMVGITEVAGSLYTIIISAGFEQQLRYFFNYGIQPRKIDPATSGRAVWYGERSLEQYSTDLRYDGFNEDSIAAYSKVLYRPMPVFFLEKLIELQLIDNEFGIEQLSKSGLSPSDATKVLAGFQNLALNSFQNNAKSLIFTLYKDGFMDVSTGTAIMNAFTVPKVQQQWIFTMANYQFNYEQKIQIRTLIIDEFKKGILNAVDAVTALTGIGMNVDRAKVLVEIAGVTTAAALTKAEKAKVLQEALSLGQVVTS